ncbi:MAG: methyltransferase domain-containing protein, partial [Terrimicrobiaceae bacterium]|nr:methyltransferase domain-containing protein [Terrimicrobiaceae bacterium]
VVGVDYSANFIEAARRLATEGRLVSEVAVEGSRTQPFCAVVDAAAHRERVRFEVGDAMALPHNLGNFDIVLAANLICRLPAPRKFLECLAGLVRPGGQLLLTTPFTWLEDYTPREHWLGGDRPSWDELREVLDCDFTLELRKDLPFLLREHARKFQYTVAVGSRWRRRS